MTGKTHLSAGISAFMYLSDKLPGKYAFLSLIFAAIGSLFADIDHPKSIINKYLLPFRNNRNKVIFYLTVGIVLLYLDDKYMTSMVVKIAGLSSIMIGLSSHRNGFTHSIFGMLIFTLIVLTFGKTYNFENIYIYFFVGYILHLICDMCTKKGVPLLYPINNKKMKFPLAYSSNSKRGKLTEEIVVLCCIIYCTLKLPTLF